MYVFFPNLLNFLYHIQGNQYSTFSGNRRKLGKVVIKKININYFCGNNFENYSDWDH